MTDLWIDLFCGAGGFSCGFLNKNNRFIGIDNWKIALETYRNNIHGETIQADITQLDVSTIGKIHGIVGSPPCQPHSAANRFASHDTTLIKKYLEIRDALKPKWWVMEEVPGAAKYGFIEGVFIHYLKACDFGLPHVRNRLFAGNYPVPRKSPFKGTRFVTHDGHGTSFIPTVQTSGIQQFKYDRDRGYPGMEKLKTMIKTPIAAMRGYYHGQEDKENIIWQAMQLLPTPDTHGYDREIDRLDKDRHVRPSTKSLENLIKTTTGLFPTPCGSSGNHVGSFEPFRKAKEINLGVSINKIITPAFCASIMGFPEDYTFSGNKTQQFKQIGNAVCPPIARAIWEAIKHNPDYKITTLDDLK